MRAEENPFRASRIEALDFRFAAGGLDDLVDRFLRAGRRGAIVGPPGSGKTTLLRAVDRCLRARGVETRWNALPSERIALALRGELEPSADDGVRGRFLERLHRCHGNVRAALHAMYWERAGSPGRWASR